MALILHSYSCRYFYKSSIFRDKCTSQPRNKSRSIRLSMILYLLCCSSSILSPMQRHVAPHCLYTQAASPALSFNLHLEFLILLAHARQPLSGGNSHPFLRNARRKFHGLVRVVKTIRTNKEPTKTKKEKMS